MSVATQAHQFLPSSNPRSDGTCARCGRPKGAHVDRSLQTTAVVAHLELGATYARSGNLGDARQQAEVALRLMGEGV